MKHKSPAIKFWLQITALAFIILALQFLASYLAFENLPTPREVIGNIYLYALTGLSFSIFMKLKNKFPTYMGFVFGALSLLKMMLGVVFLLPVLLNSHDKEHYFVIQFLLIYVIYLFFESFVLIKYLQSQD
ncbi:MAG: hypothetical protein ACQES0_00560 [Bacteroidota bacterium]